MIRLACAALLLLNVQQTLFSYEGTPNPEYWTGRVFVGTLTVDGAKDGVEETITFMAKSELKSAYAEQRGFSPASWGVGEASGIGDDRYFSFAVSRKNKAGEIWTFKGTVHNEKELTGAGSIRRVDGSVISWKITAVPKAAKKE